MIRQEGNLFILETKGTTYCFQILPSGHLEHLYYGQKVNMLADASGVSEKHHFNAGNLIGYSKEYPWLGLEDYCLEMSSFGKGDIREPFIEIIYADGSRSSDFLYESASIYKGKKAFNTLPSSYGNEDEVMSLEIILRDVNEDLKLVLCYSVYEKCDVITRSSKLINESDEKLQLLRLMSTQLDFDHNEYQFTNFCGAWAREMNRYNHLCHQGKIVNSAMTGTSSSRSNPFVMISSLEASEDFGECYGLNLIYSGNHYSSVETNSFGKLRFVSGINPQGFSYEIKSGECFEAPEAVMSFSNKGYNGMSQNMHAFVRKHIVRGAWQYKERPILINSWEAAYFNFDEGKLVKMAKAAKEVGIELFVMDDGWFGERNDDTTSLGDWEVNTKKLPKGLKGLCDKINALDMAFGIWVEPEMISEKSKCYMQHPEWAVRIPGKPHSEGRNQMLLDLTQEVVQEYIITSMSKVFESANITYVKWDMNRIFSDYYSASLGPNQQGEFCHRYAVGLYHILEALTQRFPHILFEGCAAGGNRFDLGMLCYMPQIWASDNTDGVCRAKIQTGYSYGYPMSVIGAHVSGCPNHQTLRSAPLETRFNVAAFGILGYECHIGELNSEEKEAVRAQIELYKKYRSVLQFGTYYRIQNGEDTDYTKGCYKWMSVSADQKTALGMYLQTQVMPNSYYGKFKTKGLDDNKTYHFTNRQLKYNLKTFGDLINAVSPIHIKQDSLVHHIVAKVVKMEGETEDYVMSGSMLNYMGVKLKQGFASTGYDTEIRLFQDFSSRLYIMEEVK